MDCGVLRVLEQISHGFPVMFLISGLKNLQDLSVSQPHGDVVGGAIGAGAQDLSTGL